MSAFKVTPETTANALTMLGTVAIAAEQLRAALAHKDARIAELEALLAAAEGNDARYRWLRDQMSFSTLGDAPAEMNLRAMIPAPGHNCHTDWMDARFDASVDAAVDAAMLADAKDAGSAT